MVQGLGADFKQQAITKDKDELCILIKGNSLRRHKTYKYTHIKTPNYIKQIVTLLTRKMHNLVVMHLSTPIFAKGQIKKMNKGTADLNNIKAKWTHTEAFIPQQ